MIVYVLVNKAGILFSPFPTLIVLSLLSRSRDLGNLGGKGCCHLNCFLPSSSVGFPHGSVVKNPPANRRRRYEGLIPRSRRSLGEGKGNPVQYSCLGNPMDRGAWPATVHGVARVQHNLATKATPPTTWLLWEFISIFFSCQPRLW